MDLTRYEDLLYTHANARRCMRVVFLHLVHRWGGGKGEQWIILACGFSCLL